MKILFIGTGAGDTPKIADESITDGYLPRVRELGGRNLRGPASILLEPDVRIDYHDVGPMELFGASEQAVSHLVMTHGHIDHFRPKAILEFAGKLPGGLDVYGNTMVGEAITFAATHRWDAHRGRFFKQEIATEVRNHTVGPGETFMVADASFTALASNHFIDKTNLVPEQQALNYIIERDGKTFFYGLDSSYPLPEAIERMQDFRFDAAVFDATFGPMDIDLTGSGHMNFAIVEELVAELRSYGTITDDTVVLLSHLSIEIVPPHDDIADKMAARGLQLPYDGLRLEL